MTTAAERHSVFIAALPTVAYHGVRRPDVAHDVIARARQRAPIALGPMGRSYSVTTWFAWRYAIRASPCRTPMA